MKKLFILLATYFALNLDTKAHVYQINICYTYWAFTNLCVGDTLRFTGDSTISSCYGVVQCWVYNSISNSYDYFPIVSSNGIATSHDHILINGDSEYRGLYYEPGYPNHMLFFNCTNEIIEEINSSHNFHKSLYPNPSNGKFVVTQLNNFKTIEICNILGKLIYQENIENNIKEIEIDLSTVPKGIYFVKLDYGKQIHTEKLIIN